MESWLEAFAQTNFARSADTAHDLKTPLNVAVLNLELLRMRMARLGGAEKDEKIAAYARSIEIELRRLALIFDTFFLLSAPPKSEGPPLPVDIVPLFREAAETAGFEVDWEGSFRTRGHESRIRQALRMFFDGAAHVFRSENRRAHAERNGEHYRVAVSGTPQSEPFEIDKIFKFYYTDPLGNPDLSLATARLIVETYGGELIATEERDTFVTIVLTFPGDQE
jgi:signal transduction histidine kinase